MVLPMGDITCYFSVIIVRALKFASTFNPIALRKAKIVYNFGLPECNRVNISTFVVYHVISISSSLVYKNVN